MTQPQVSKRCRPGSLTRRSAEASAAKCEDNMRQRTICGGVLILAFLGCTDLPIEEERAVLRELGRMLLRMSGGMVVIQGGKDAGSNGSS